MIKKFKIKNRKILFKSKTNKMNRQREKVRLNKLNYFKTKKIILMIYLYQIAFYIKGNKIIKQISRFPCTNHNQ